jgi:hypothetical protein
MLKVPGTTTFQDEGFVGDKRRGSQSHMARRVQTKLRHDPFDSGAQAADYAMKHGGTWALLIAARAGESRERALYQESDEQTLARIRKNIQQNILGRCRRGGDGWFFL